MAATVTVTGVTGPAQALTAVIYTNVLSICIDAVLNILRLEFTPGIFTYITVVAAATVIATKSGSTWTLTIS
jgi:hypothetical protein